MSDDRSVRSSQLISPYGTGAIVDIGDESLMLTDLKGWPRHLEDIVLDRLARELGVRSLKAPPKTPEYGRSKAHKAVESIRFPRWMFCPSCRRMTRWTNKDENDNDKPVCGRSTCKQRALVPMRFVMACEQGHAEDVAWGWWAHSRAAGGKCSTKDYDRNLYFKSRPEKGSGLDALYVECKECGANRDLGNITAPGAMKSIGVKCKGNQPWESWDDCEQDPVVLQRGASNLFYPIVRSALDIPVAAAMGAESELFKAVKSHASFETFRSLLVDMDNEAAARGVAEMIALDNGCSVEDVLGCIDREGDDESFDGQLPTPEELQFAEWEVLVSPDVTSYGSKNFSARVAQNLDVNDHWGIAGLIERVVLLDKLREVRAFCGYERVKTGVNKVPPAGRHDDIKWLPAIEVFGEGIFIQLSEQALTNWESKACDFIDHRVAPLLARFEEGGIGYLPEPNVRLVALHTFAHLLIRQLSFECGYSSGSIRERIYAVPGQAGVLIYTADSDSEGSLGGLVQQGEPELLIPTIAAAIDVASWCSNDPVCSEMETQGVMGLNKAACHSCTLVSETSCTMNNLMLDRKLLLGDENSYGLFSTVLTNIKTGK